MGTHRNESASPTTQRVGRPAQRSRAAVVTSAGVAAGLLALSAVWMGSNAAFTAQTDNPSNHWAAGSVSLTDDDAAVVAFNQTGIAPGASGSKCIAVTYGGSLASAVKLYSSGYAQTNGLGGQLLLTVTLGTGGGFSAGCGSFVAGTGGVGNVLSGVTFDTFGVKTNYANGAATAWSPTGAGQTKVFKIDWSLPSNVTTGQGGSVDVGFVWEAQNT